MKKLISLALAVLMVLSLAVAASATGTERPTSGTFETVEGTITINGITLENNKPTATYAIYQILKVNSFNFTTGSYDYDYANDAWETFFTAGAGKDYVGQNEQGILAWKGSADADRVANFAKLALAYAEANSIAPTKTTAAEPLQYTVNDNSIVFSDLPLGYYLVDSTVGALCGLSTTNPDGIINSKNGIPTLEKQVQEDLGGQWGKVNTADIGQNVNFRVTIHVHDGAQNYTLHDEMEPGLKYMGNLTVMIRDGATGDETTYEATSEVTENGQTSTVTNYTFVPTTDADGDIHTFNVIFTPEFCKHLNTNDRLIISYTAMVTRDAEIGNGTQDNQPNVNTAHLHFGEGHKTNADSTVTKTYGFDLVKTDGQNKLLPGAKFRIYHTETSTDATKAKDEVTVVPLMINNGGTQVQKTDEYGRLMYRKARADEPGQEIDVTNGAVRVVGLDNGVYWLEETKHPSGYNPIEGRQKFTIADNNLDAIITNDIISTNSGVQVVNHTGSMLPETGGLGTLMFTVLGGGTALSTGVVLVTKKRMSKIKDED